MPEGDILKSEVGTGSERRPGCSKYGEREHAAIYHLRSIPFPRAETRETSRGSGFGGGQVRAAGPTVPADNLRGRLRLFVQRRRRHAMRGARRGLPI